MNLLMILKLNYRVVKEAKWKNEFQIIPSNFCERIVAHLELSKTEVECFITRFQTPRNKRKHEAVVHVFLNETIENDAMTCFLFAQPRCEDSLSCFERENRGNVSFQMKNIFHRRGKPGGVSSGVDSSTCMIQIVVIYWRLTA